jgi:hypothetical protein
MPWHAEIPAATVKARRERRANMMASAGDWGCGMGELCRMRVSVGWCISLAFIRKPQAGSRQAAWCVGTVNQVTCLAPPLYTNR